MERLSRNLSFCQALEISRRYVLLRTVILQKKALGVLGQSRLGCPENFWADPDDTND